VVVVVAGGGAGTVVVVAGGRAGTVVVVGAGVVTVVVVVVAAVVPGIVVVAVKVVVPVSLVPPLAFMSVGAVGSTVASVCVCVRPGSGAGVVATGLSAGFGAAAATTVVFLGWVVAFLVLCVALAAGGVMVLTFVDT
jgi:hypothetical protein